MRMLPMVMALAAALSLAGCSPAPVQQAPLPVPPPRPVLPPPAVVIPPPPAPVVKPKPVIPPPQYLPTPPPVAQPQIAALTVVPAARALLDKARLARRQGLLPEADALLERALRMSPRDAALYLETAQVRLQQGDFAGASQFAQKSLSMLGAGDELTQRQARLEAWGVIAEARTALGDETGAAAAAREVQRWQ